MELFSLWMLSGLIGLLISQNKGEAFVGLVLGLLLGPLGWVLAALSSGDRKSCPHCLEKMRNAASICPHCKKSPKEAVGAGLPK